MFWCLFGVLMRDLLVLGSLVKGFLELGIFGAWLLVMGFWCRAFLISHRHFSVVHFGAWCCIAWRFGVVLIEV